MLEPSTERTLKTMNSSMPILPLRTFSPMVERYSWIFSTTTSVSSPDSTWSKTYLNSLGREHKAYNLRTEITYWDTVFDKRQYSRRFMSRPLISVRVFPPSSTLTAAYFFFCNRSKRWKTLSRSISSNLYRSLTCFLNSCAVFNASARSVTFELTKTESVSP